MLQWRRKAAQKPPPGRRTLKAIVNSHYSMILASILGVASATYFFIIGPRNVIALTGITVTFAASALNVSYLVLHHILAWRYAWENACFYRHQNSTLRSACMMTSGMVIVAWLTASILGLIAASKAPFCSKNAAGTIAWKTIDGCKIQRASVAGSLLNLFNSCVLFYALKTSNRPFAASLKGISNGNHTEELDLARQFSFVTASESPSEKHFVLHCDPNCYSAPVTPTPKPRGRRSWLPRLDFQLSPAYEYPTIQSSLNQGAFAHSQTNLLPSSSRRLTNHFSPPSFDRSYSAEHANYICRPSLSRSQTADTLSSSIYSRSTNSESDFSYSSSSLRSTFYNYSSSIRVASSRTEVPVPAIPERYLYKSHNVCSVGQPVRPGSRPGMPPPEFWTYASQEQIKSKPLSQSQVQKSQRRGRRLSVWPGDANNLQNRPRGQSESPRRVRSQIRSPKRSPTKSAAVQNIPHNVILLTSPDRAVLRGNMNRGNVDVRKNNQSYESLRKGGKTERKNLDFAILEQELPPTKGHGRKDSRTLVKMRQPWDSPPRSPVKSEGSGRRV